MARSIPDRSPATRTSLDATAIAFLFGVWLLCRPYEGFIHDGILYAGQALRHLHPEIFDGDLFFAGAASQDDFTVFGWVYGTLAGTLGLSVAALLLYALGQAAWFTVALVWIRSVAPGLALPAIACLLALRYPYSTDGRLELAESFVTARLLAEPLVLAALLLVWRGRLASGIATLAVAAVVHPLIAAPAAAIVALLWLAGRVGWMRASVLAVAAVALVAVVPVLGTVPRMDPEWLDLVRTRNHFVIPAGWSVDGVARWLAVLLMLASAAAVVRTGLADLWRAAALAGALGVALALIGYHAGWVVVIQAQAWRAIWPAMWLAPLAVVSACLALAPERRGMKIRMLGLLPAFAFAQLTWVPGAGVVALAYAAIVRLSIEDRRGWFGQRSPAAAAIVASGLALLAVGAGSLAILAVAFASDVTDPLDRRLPTFALRMLGWAALAGLAWWASATSDAIDRGSPQRAGRERRLRWVAIAVLVPAFALFDARPPTAREAQRNDVVFEQWRSLIPETAQVYWPERHRYVWIRLQRRSYVSFSQSAGILFDRATAVEAYRRRGVVEAISARDGVFSLANVGTIVPAPTPSDSDLRRTCAADRSLDFLVLAGEIPGNLGPIYHEPFSAAQYRLYACRDFR